MTKRLAFIQPAIYVGSYMPPLGVLTMAAIMEKEGWQVRFFNEYLDANALKSLIDFRPGIVGISTVTPTVLSARELARKIKAALPKTIIVFGGPHPSAMPQEVASWDAVDFVIVGEGEYALRDLGEWYNSGRRAQDLKKVANICYTNNGNFFQNERLPFLSPEQLDQLPTPAFHLLNLEKTFKKTQHGLFRKGNRILHIMSSRGCPNQCTFCCRAMGSRIRYRNPNLVLKEIEEIVERFRLDEVWFSDDNFTADKNRAHKILDLLIERNLGIYFKCNLGLRADAIDFGLLEKMKKAGFYALSFGIESGSARILKLMKKHLSLDKIKQNLRLAKSMGFLIGGNCIIGYPEETAEDIKESLDYFMDLDLDSMATVNLIPFPGTEVRQICEEKGYLTASAQNWDNYIYDLYDPKILIETEFLDVKTCKRMLNLAYRRMYLRPKVLHNILRHTKPKDIAKGIKVMAHKFL